MDGDDDLLMAMARDLVHEKASGNRATRSGKFSGSSRKRSSAFGVSPIRRKGVIPPVSWKPSRRP